VLCRRKAHWLKLKQMLEAAGVDVIALWGATCTDERERAKKLFEEGKLATILATTIFDEGEDVPGIDAIVLAEGVKVNTNAIQRIGRGMRKKKGANDVWVIDFIPTCHSTLGRHGLIRCETYESEGFEVVPIYEWPACDEEMPECLLPFDDWR